MGWSGLLVRISDSSLSDCGSNLTSVICMHGGEGLLWLTGVVVCLHAAPGVQLFASPAMDGCIMFCGIISSCTMGDCKALLDTSLTCVSSAVASNGPVLILSNLRLMA